jgi:Copper amine oxidase, enzyme domain
VASTCKWTIRPRFGFSAVNSSSCVCNTHHHHAYWRFDFDIRTAGNNRIREFNNPPIIGLSNWHNKNYEIKRFRDPSRRRKWRVENTVSGEAYDIIPGPDDGNAISSPDWPFPRGDVWLLRYRGTELDDGVVAIGPPYEADLDRFANGESINAKDVVVWYSAHFSHDTASEPSGVHGHIVGPSLRPVRW